MSSSELSRLVDALTEIAGLLDRLGVPGVVVLILTGPALVLCAIILVEYHRGRRVQEMVDTARAESRAVLETYRADTQHILRELGSGLQQNELYYQDNVDLVKQYDFLAKNLQDVVVSNTRATERLIVMLEERRKQS